MILRSLELNKFRNYSDGHIQFNDKRNIFCGKNAQGKSNILESVYLLCISRSFRTRFEKETIQFTENECSVKGEFLLDNGQIKNVVFFYNREEGKQVSINRKRINKLSDYIGQFPVVLSSPEEYDLTSGPPASRRRFIDILLSQISTKYIHNLQDYYQILKQRNHILNEGRFNRRNVSNLIAPWNESFIEKAVKLVWERLVFSKRINELIETIYSDLSVNNEKLNFKYNNFSTVGTPEELKDAFLKKMASNENFEIEQGKTLIGPHRDDFLFTINDKELRKFGSRGQHKTVLIALMIAEFQLIKEKVRETPVILVDDLFSELDKNREEKILSYIKELGQNLLTTTLPVEESSKYTGMEKTSYFHVDSGNVEISS